MSRRVRTSKQIRDRRMDRSHQITHPKGPGQKVGHSLLELNRGRCSSNTSTISCELVTRLRLENRGRALWRSMLWVQFKIRALHTYEERRVRSTLQIAVNCIGESQFGGYKWSHE